MIGWGRDLAARFDLDHHGTFWILGRFHELGMFKSPDLRVYFRELQERGIRLPWGEVNALLVRLGEEPLDPNVKRP